MGYPQYEPYPSVPAPAPGGGTAITAGVLASIGSVGQLLGGGFNIVLGLTDLTRDLSEYDSTGLFAQSWIKTYLLVAGSIAVVTAFLLGIGAIMMFTRRPLGRVLVVAGCAVVVIAGITEYAVTLHYTSSGGSAAEIGGGIGGLIGLIFPIATAVLALVPATTRWLNHNPAAAPPVAMYPYGPGAPTAGHPSGPAVPPAGYPSGPAVPPAGYPSGSTPYPPSPYPQYGPSADVPPYPQAGTDQAGAQPQWGANPQAAPDSPPPDLAKRQSDPTMHAEDSPWRRPPSQ
ncbi:hypothetical protein [Nocardia sp. CA-120079]|uniref:hypothetical protein n=1 Tax=Nocardia sp. CA-120079 TaxID=3239974 RepID=UPI003D9560CB